MHGATFRPKHLVATQFMGLSALFTLLCPAMPAFSDSDVIVRSPGRNVQIRVVAAEKSGLSYSVTRNKQPVIESSGLGIVVDGVNLGQGAAIQGSVRYPANESYPTRGVHSQAINRSNGARISIEHRADNTHYTLEVRAYDDGVAFRYIVPGTDKDKRTPDEATLFTLPEGSTVWYHDFRGHYEGVHSKKSISEIAAGDWAAVPLTFKLPNALGYASITEAALMNSSGMGLEAQGHRTFAARLGHAEPPSYPFILRYGEQEAKRLAVPAITSTITTPWRVILIGPDLNTLVNSDIITNVSPPPDPKLFPEGMNTSWIRPGRAVWKYLDGGENTLEGTQQFSQYASELGFEYNVIEGFWHKWSDDQVRDLVAYSNQRHVRLLVWEFSKELRDAEKRRDFFRRLHDLGIAGAKIDFFDHEAKETVDLYDAILQDAAENQELVVFHGANKPTGQLRTWPNELTREAVAGLEHRNIPAWSPHTTTLPFTRLLAGPADFTPMIFGERRKETSWPNEIASAAILTSPLLTFAANPVSMLENPGVNMIKSIPSTWDKTVVLPVSEIGEIAAFARCKGDNWFLAVMNGPSQKTIHVALSFLASGTYKAMLIRDDPENPAAEKIENTSLSRSDSLTIGLRAGGGFIAKFSK